MWQAKAYKVLPKIVSTYSTHRWLFATFTVKNCEIEKLRDTLAHMNKGFNRMVERKVFPAAGWLRAMEVTRGKNGQAHPHFHCLLMVPPDYFSRGYIKQAEWVGLWRDCMRLDYSPLVDIKALRIGQDPLTLVPELLKYCVKEGDLTADREWFIELTQQLHKMRAIATGGVLKEYLRELEQEPEDLIGEGEDEEEKDYERLLFGWRTNKKRYKQVTKMTD
jgi:plasmid rolling circle replication initiator protein Rep